MDCTSTSITFEQTGHFSRIVTDYIGQSPLLMPFYHHPPTLEGLHQSMEARKGFPVNRQLLVNELRKQYKDMPIAAEAERNISSLLDERTFTVVTAHQPNIFTGFLYYIYKILHTVKLAESLKKQYPGYHFIPVFYMGSEDADLDELGKIYMDGEKIVWQTQQKGAVGRMNTEGLDKIIARIEGELGIHPYGPELIGLLKDYYQGSTNVQTATFRLIHHLFAAYGVVVLIPDNGHLKTAMTDIFKDDLLHQTPSAIVEKTIDRLAAHYKVQAHPREINLFYLKDDIRERIVKTGEQWTVVNHPGIRFNQQQLEEELAHHPERFSPNVILRGLFQEIILPNIAYVGGGGEIAYWLELKDLFEHYKVPYPVILLRNSFLFIQSKWQHKLTQLGFTPADFFQDELQLTATYVKRNSTLQLDLDNEIRQAHQYYDHLKAVSGKVDKSLEQHVDALRTRALQRIQELEKKMLRSEKRKFDAAQRQIHAIKQALFPGDGLQERTDNFMPYYARWGTEFIKVMYEHSPDLAEGFGVISQLSE